MYLSGCSIYLSGHNMYLSEHKIDIYYHIHIHIYQTLHHISVWAQYVSVRVQYIDIYYHINIHINIHIHIHIYGQLNHISVQAQYVSVWAKYISVQVQYICPGANPHNPHGPGPAFFPYVFLTNHNSVVNHSCGYIKEDGISQRGTTERKPSSLFRGFIESLLEWLNLMTTLSFFGGKHCSDLFWDQRTNNLEPLMLEPLLVGSNS